MEFTNIFLNHPPQIVVHMVCECPFKESSIPNSGEGVYAIKDLPPQKPAAFLSMFLYNMEQSLLYSKQW